MTPEKLALYEIHDMIAALPETDRAVVQAIASLLRNVAKNNEHAMLAYALVGAELSEQADRAYEAR